jgi:hypothetical protein
MCIAAVKTTGYDIEYIKRMPFFSFLDLWETIKEVSENSKA